MTRARRRAFLLGALIALTAALVASAFIGNRQPPPASPVGERGNRPTLLLLPGLPLVFGESFDLDQQGSPVLRALQARYHVVPISVADGAELAKGSLLLMAQPRAQTAENLVVLDSWVRRGGRVLLLADPMLEWPSTLPMGDLTRAPPMFADTGLLAHWGLRLDAPDARGPAKRMLGGQAVLTLSPGSLSGNCTVAPDKFVAECEVGAGRVSVVADADFLNVDKLGSRASDNIRALVGALAKLQQ